jgi:uncharacterized protein YerC
MQKQIQIQKQAYVEQEEEELDPREKLRRWLECLKKVGVVMTYSYHCKRCNHVWFPKDFDAMFENAFITIDMIINFPSPKACARCKSKYWNSPPKRKTKHSSMKPITDNQAKIRERDLDKMHFFGHDMLTIKRLKTHARLYRKGIAAIFRVEKKYREVFEKQGIDTTKLDAIRKIRKSLEEYRKIDPVDYNRIKKQVDKENLEDFSKEYYGT